MFWSENIGIITGTPLQKNCFGWELPNFFACQCKPETEQVVPQIVTSPWFSAFERSWRLALVRNGVRDQLENVGLFVWLKSSFMMEAPNIAVKFTLFDYSGKDYKTFEGKVDYNGSFGTWSFLEFSKFSEIQDAISSSGVIRIYCLMTEKTSLGPVCPQSSTAGTFKDNDSESDKESDEKDEPQPKGIYKLVRQLKSLMDDEMTSDVTLKVGDRQFKAHKAILKVRSPAFAAMFKHGTKAREVDLIDIPDCSSAVFEVLLLYIYTGTVALSSENVFDLYYAADKYHISDLNLECVEFMENNLSVDNFCEVMALSMKYGESRLQKTATRFFGDNIPIITTTVQWQKFVKDYPTESNELFLKLLKA